MTNADLRVKEKIEIHPINQNRTHQKNLLPTTSACWLADRKSTRLNSSHLVISYAVFCLKKKKQTILWHQTPLQTPLNSAYHGAGASDSSRRTRSPTYFPARCTSSRPSPLSPTCAMPGT